MKKYNPRKIRKQLDVSNEVLLSPKAPDPKIIDTSLLEVLTHNGIFNPEECAKVIADNTPEVWGYAAVNTSATDDGPTIKEDWRISKNAWIENSAENIWLFDKMLALVVAANQRYQFEVDYFESIQLAKYEEGMFYDWHLDLGPGRMGNRKISVTVQLSSPDDYEGGDLVLEAGADEDFVASRELGCVTVFPSFLKHKVTPVTKGTRHSLVVWASGTHRFK